MNFGRRVAFLAALAVLAIVAVGGTTARSAPEASGKPRLTAFGSCGQLLGYARAQAKRFVGPYGFGALADFRYYIETIEPLIIYPTISVGFLAGPERITQQNAVMPLFNPGLGVKMKFGNVYGAFEFGLSGFTIPFVVFILGYDGDSKITKEAERLRIAEETAPEPSPRATP